VLERGDHLLDAQAELLRVQGGALEEAGAHASLLGLPTDPDERGDVCARAASIEAATLSKTSLAGSKPRKAASSVLSDGI
jgi:hypothetical protein